MELARHLLLAAVSFGQAPATQLPPAQPPTHRAACRAAGLELSQAVVAGSSLKPVEAALPQVPEAQGGPDCRPILGSLLARLKTIPVRVAEREQRAKLIRYELSIWMEDAGTDPRVAEPAPGAAAPQPSHGEALAAAGSRIDGALAGADALSGRTDSAPSEDPKLHRAYLESLVEPIQRNQDDGTLVLTARRAELGRRTEAVARRRGSYPSIEELRGLSKEVARDVYGPEDSAISRSLRESERRRAEESDREAREAFAGLIGLIPGAAGIVGSNFVDPEPVQRVKAVTLGQQSFSQLGILGSLGVGADALGLAWKPAGWVGKGVLKLVGRGSKAAGAAKPVSELAALAAEKGGKTVGLTATEVLEAAADRSLKGFERLPDGALESVRAHALAGSMGIEDWVVYQARQGDRRVLVTAPKGDVKAFTREVNRRREFEAAFGSSQGAGFEINRAQYFGEGRVSEVFGKQVPADVDPRTALLVTEMIPGAVPLRSFGETAAGKLDPAGLKRLVDGTERLGYAIASLPDHVYARADGSAVLTSLGKLIKKGEPGYEQALERNRAWLAAAGRSGGPAAAALADSERLAAWAKLQQALSAKRALNRAEALELDRIASEYVKSERPLRQTEKEGLVRIFLSNRIPHATEELRRSAQALPPAERSALAARLDELPPSSRAKPGHKLLFVRRGSEINDKMAAEHAAGQRLGFGAGQPFQRPFKEEAWVQAIYIEDAVLPRAHNAGGEFGAWLMASQRALFDDHGALRSAADIKNRYATPAKAAEVSLIEIKGSVAYRGPGAAVREWGEGGAMQVALRNPELDKLLKKVGDSQALN